MKIINYLNRVIEYSFYSLFLITPLIFSGSTSELFEFPKMWFTFALTIVISACWVGKMIIQKKVYVQRTPLDIPIILFLAANIVSTIFSLDSHVSLWGFYSRFNGGLLSIIAYIVLYYAFVTHLSLKNISRTLKVVLVSGVLVALWGLPSHFGIDFTCYVFRQTFDTSCWTEAFKPTIRIFSTLGQPAWLAAFMSLLIPIALSFALVYSEGKKLSISLKNKKVIGFLIVSFMFYAALTYTDTRGGFIGFWVANIVFWVIIYFKKLITRKNFLNYLLFINSVFFLFNFFQGIPISQISQFTIPQIIKGSSASHVNTNPRFSTGELGGTDSGKIRLLVWRGAVDAWIDHPVIGTGVETFAYAYYKYKPVAHNLTTEWDFLYNKAHNEYLNYLATTGAFGLGSYLGFIGVFLFIVLNKWSNGQIVKWFQKSHKTIKPFSHKFSALDEIEEKNNNLIVIGLFSGWVSILVSNFFGFSVVIINIYFFLIPAITLILLGKVNSRKKLEKVFGVFEKDKSLNPFQIVFIIGLVLSSALFFWSIYRYWKADIAYSKGSSLSKGGDYQNAYPFLAEAMILKPNEPLYKDELALNLTTLASALYLQKDASNAAEFKKQALELDDEVLNNHPNNIVFWKNRVRLYYTLAQGDEKNEKQYFNQALTAVLRAQELAPNDAKISYNLGILLGQTGDIEKAIETLEQTIKLKPNYRDAYYALGLFYHEQATDENGNVIDPAVQKKAEAAYQYILTNIDPQDQQVKEALEEWEKN